MFCKNCGTPLADGQRFCPNCGVTIELPTAPAEPIASPTPVQPDTFAEPAAGATLADNGVPVQDYVSNEFNQAPFQPAAGAEQYAAPIPPMAPPPAPQKSKKGLIITLSIVLAVLIAAGACLAIFWDDLFGKKKSSKDDDKGESTSDIASNGDENGSSLTESATNGLGSELDELIPQLPSSNATDSSEYQAGTTSNSTPSNSEDSNATESVPSNSTQSRPSAGSSNNASIPSTSTQKYLNAEELARSTEAQQMMNAMNQSFASIGIRLKVSGVGNQLYYDCVFLQQIDASTYKPSLDQALASKTAQFNDLVETFQSSIIMPDFTMRVRYLNADGTLITEAVYPR